MDKVYKYIIEETTSQNMNRQTAINLIKLLEEQQVDVNQTKDIAIIGIANKLPLADTPEDFWRNIVNNEDCIRNLPINREKDCSLYMSFTNTNKDMGINYMEMGYLDEIDTFDYSFFKLSPKEASLMDPNQRLFLETSWKAIEDAGYGGKRIRGSKTGVYIGIKSDDYYSYRNLIMNTEPHSAMVALPGNLISLVASRISYLLDLKGPSMAVDTSCSSSLVAIHLACKAIKDKECEMAIAGGIKLNILPISINEKIGIESSSGRARTFDDSADGTAMGEGVIAILLKPLEKAVEDRDNIYAVIKGSAINQDGQSIGIAAPNAEAQEEVIVKAWEDAGINPETITYIEAHGTGTKLGDPIEIEGIQRAFNHYTHRKQFCAIGSVKTQIGHLDNAAGIAGLVKGALALKHKQLPPIPYFKKPNKIINFEESPVYVNSRLTDWLLEHDKRRCGVSSFGFSGTNCHVVMEEAPEIQTDAIEGYTILTLSAPQIESFKSLIRAYYRYLDSKTVEFKSMCFTANTGREHYTYRLALIVKDISDCKQQLLELTTEAFTQSIQNKTVFFMHHKEEDISQLIHIEAEECMKTYASHRTQDIEKLKKICEYYVKGADIKWELLYKNEKLKKVSLPTYPFKKDRCWVKIPRVSSEVTEQDTFYKLVWKHESLDNPLIDKQNTAEKNTILILGEVEEKVNELAEFFDVQQHNSIQVIFHKKCESIKHRDYGYQTNGELENLKKLIQEIDIASLTKVVFVAPTLNLLEKESHQQFDSFVDDSLMTLVNICKVLDKELNHTIDVIIITNKAYSINVLEDEINPYHAILHGIGKAIHWECQSIKLRFIDIDYNISIMNLVQEINNTVNNFQVGYRNGLRYVQCLEQDTYQSNNESKIAIQDNGMYVITGGLGGIGLELAKHLSKQNPVHIILIGRSNFPIRSEWDKVMPTSKLHKKIKILKDIEENGSKVEIYQADVSNYVTMKSVINTLKNRYGTINGVLHCAGLNETCKIEHLTSSLLKDVLSPKVLGAINLHRLTEDIQLDFFMMFSSVITLIGESGASAYIGANSFLDAYSHVLSKMGTNAVTVNWPPWVGTGMAEGLDGMEDKLLFKPITPSGAVVCFEKVPYLQINQLFVGDLNEDSPIFQLGDLLPFNLSNKLQQSFSQKVNDAMDGIVDTTCQYIVELTGRSDGNYTQLERQIACAWKEVLGYEELNIHTNFFEIGGDSIMITKVHGMLEDFYPNLLKITDFFAYPTISKLAEYIQALQAENIRKSSYQNQIEEDEALDHNIDKLVSDIESGNISIDEAVDFFEMEQSDE